MNRHVVVLILLATVAVPVIAQQNRDPILPTRDAKCSDFATLDVKNMTVKSLGRVFVFRRGKAYNFDLPEYEANKPDWEATIEKDTTVSPAPGVAVRFLLINDSHLTGSGWQFYLIGLRCAPSNSATGAAQLQNVFEVRAMSLSVKELDNDGIIFTTHPIYRKPATKYFSYKWDVDSATFKLEKTWMTSR